MLDTEIHELLRELADATGATDVSIVHVRPPKAQGSSNSEKRDFQTTVARFMNETNLCVMPLGRGVFLQVELTKAAATACDRDDRRAEIERCARALRDCARRWGADRVPAIRLSDDPRSAIPNKQRVLARIRTFLEALANTPNALATAVVVRGEVVAESAPLDEIHTARIAFTRRRLQVEAQRQGRSHADICGDDYYAVSFWYDACLIAFFSGPYAVDFFRHRAKLVTRELATLLPTLDDPPPASVSAAPLPD